MRLQLQATVLLMVLQAAAIFNINADKSAEQPEDSKVLTANSTSVDDKPNHTIGSCAILHDEITDCSGRNLTSIPQLPFNSRCIRLNANMLSNISTLPFHGMNRLQSLDLSGNPLQYISPYLFMGLTNLTHLYLKDTLLHKQLDLDFETLFMDTKYLKEFHLTFSNWSLRQPCMPTQSLFMHVETLHNIQVLELDSMIFKHLTETNHNPHESSVECLFLTNINAVCGLNKIQRKDLQHFPLLHTFEFVTEQVLPLKVETTAFSKLPNLSELTIRCKYRCIYFDSAQIKDLLHNISVAVSMISHLEVLRLEGLVDKDGYAINSGQIWANISQLKRLKTLDLNQNSFYFIDKGQLRGPPSVLTTLEINHNCFHLEDILLSIVEGNYDKLEYIYAEFQNECSTSKKRSLKEIQQYTQGVNFLFQAKLPLRKINLSYCIRDYNVNMFLSTFFFPNLTHMQFSWIRKKGDHSVSVRNDFSATRPNLVHLELIGCQINNIAQGAFSEARVLINLTLASNNLGKMGSNLSNEINNLTSLQRISLASNNIKVLDKSIFRKMQNLNVIGLNGNMLESFEPYIQHLKHLRLLDISNNHIRKLPHTLRQTLDMINQHRQLKLNLSGNPLICSCNTLEFVKWTTHTKVTIISGQTTSCFLPNGTEVTLSNFAAVIESLQVTCSSKPATGMAVALSVALVFVVLILIGVLIIYRYRWKLRYLYYITKFRFNNKSQNLYEQTYNYDAFISYSSNDHVIARTACIDHLENTRGLTLCINERDFIPGEEIAYNISAAIHSSRRTVLFISTSFLESDWCRYELNIARMEALHAKRSVIVIVLLESSVQSKLPIDILDMIRTTTYLEYPEHGCEDNVTLFWTRLADCIQQ